MPISEVWKTFEVRYRGAEKYGFRVVHVVSLIREVGLRLSIAFEIQLSSLCVRFALTLPTAKSGGLHLSKIFENEFSSSAFGLH